MHAKLHTGHYVCTYKLVSVAYFRNFADVVVLEDADVVAPVHFSGGGVDVDDKARLEVGGGARLGVVLPATERVASDRRPRCPVLTVPHPLIRHEAVHTRRPERLATCPHTHTHTPVTFRTRQ